MGHVFICLSTKPRDDLQEVLVRYLFWGSIRVGVEGKRKPPVCVALDITVLLVPTLERTRGECSLSKTLKK